MFGAYLMMACTLAEAAKRERELEEKRLEGMTHEQRMEYWAQKQAEAAQRQARAAEARQTIIIHNHTSIF